MIPGWLERTLRRVGLDATDREPARILLVDDSPTNLSVLTQTLRPLGDALLIATNGARALDIAKRNLPALVLLDVMMPEIDGFEVCRRMKADPELADIPIVFCSALDDAAVRVTGLKLGAVDFVTKPYDPAEIVARVTTHLAIGRLLRGLEARNHEIERELAYARETRKDALRRMQEVLVGSSAPVEELRRSIASLARSSEPVLIVSDPGCGEEAVARAIHEGSARSNRPFFRVECPVLRADDVGGLFGGASGNALARLGLAGGGTVFFEGMHRMPDELGAPLFALIDGLDVAAADGSPPPIDLRFVGSVTVLATASQPSPVLARWRSRARCRKTLRLPTLAERRDDIPALVAFFMERHANHVGRSFETASAETLRELSRHWWPGNLRELEEVVRNGVLRSQRATLEIDTRMLSDGIPFGSYRLLRQLSAGGMGTIWEAQHQLLARPAVVKLIRAAVPGDRRMLERRFELEARATAKLRSPHTVTIFDYGISEEGDFFYVMEKLEGIDLERAVAEHGPMPAARVVALLMQACRSLAEAHAMGLVHRDIKPANLFLCKLGLDLDVLKVLDFGVVKWGTGDDVAVTMPSEQYCGTPAFMAPEASTNPDAIDGRADVYALGCVAYWLLTGRLPFEAPTAVGIVVKHLMEVPEPPSRHAARPIPPEIEALVLRCLAKDPAARPTAAELHASLDETRLFLGWTAGAALAWWNDHLPALMRPA